MEEATQPSARAKSLPEELVDLASLIHELMAECEQLRRENAELKARLDWRPGLDA